MFRRVQRHQGFEILGLDMNHDHGIRREAKLTCLVMPLLPDLKSHSQSGDKFSIIGYPAIRRLTGIVEIIL